MRALWRALSSGSQALSYAVGGLVVILAVAMARTALAPEALLAWSIDVFGATFLLLLAGLVFTALYCWVRLMRQPGSPVWLEAGLEAAGGITTLALTFTLLGITLGIGTLAEHELTPETIQGIIRGLTAKFSLAFLTTVVGLPLSAVLRTLLMVTDARHRSRTTSN